ncbi:hypothetical protein [Lactobacillus crispatus]|uniref:hypothetical protein n=1 Tax=Lactobacillus crispatus TaxID=47770 RepID=UPI0021A6D6CE|nr:hypothetical protein [Lactobacillus crispatus]MCT3539944.1 hypothetical protein [Lactobacillus crispatus]
MYGDDDTHITGQITFEQIAEAIRHKKYGRDMREAIAQGFEQFIGLLGRVSKLESEYSNLQSKYNDIIGRLNDDENEIHDLQDKNIALSQRCDKIEEKHNDDIKKVQGQLDRLNQAVFGYGEYEVNYETPHHDSSVTEINMDSNPLLKGE